MKLKKILTTIGILVLLLLISASVFADGQTASDNALLFIEPDYTKSSGEIDIGEYGLFYDVSEGADGRLYFGILNQNGKLEKRSSADKIKIVELGYVNGTVYTAKTETEYDCTDDTLSKLKTLDGTRHKPYIAGYKTDASGKVSEICLPGKYGHERRRETNFGLDISNRRVCNFINASDAVIGNQAYRLYDTPVIYGYNYNFDEVEVSVMDPGKLTGESHYGHIYDTTSEGHIKLMLISQPNKNNNLGIIHSVTGYKDRYDIKMYSNGKLVTLSTTDKKVLDNYKYQYPGTDYSNKIASEFYPGAVIRYSENENAKIDKVKKVYPVASESGKAADETPYYQKEFYSLFNSSPFKGTYDEFCDCFTAYGKITGKQTINKIITIETTVKKDKNTPSYQWFIMASFSQANITVVDYSKDDENIVTAGTADDIKEGSYALIRKTAGATMDVIIFKNFNPDEYAGIARVDNVKLDKTSVYLNVGNMDVLKATVSPYNAASKKIIWDSSNPDVAQVSDGIITAKSEGTAIITVTTDDGGKTAQCTVTVGARQQMSISELTTDNGVKFTVNLSPEPRGKLIAALYDEEGRLVQCHTVAPDKENVGFEFLNTGSKVKIIWHDSELRPFTKEIKFDI